MIPRILFLFLVFAFAAGADAWGRVSQPNTCHMQESAN
jgi:hypothetical protein